MASELSLHRDLNLIITGYIEPNRPRIARQLAQRLGMEMIDVERRIEERYGETIDRIRVQYGERRLRAIESEVLDDIALYRRALIRVTGSTLVNSRQLEDLQRNGIVVCLVASLDSILRRIHLTLGARYHNPVERSLAIGELQREWKIREAANIVEFDATYISEPELIDQIANYWRDIALRRA